MSASFLRVWLATGVTAVSSQVGQLVIPLIAVLTFGASPSQVGLLAAAQWLPFLLLALPVGVLADRRQRRPLLVAAETVRAVAATAIVLLGAAGVLNLTILMLLAFAAGAGTVLFEIAYQALVPSLVPEGGLDTANSRLQATEATALVGGPGLGGVLMQAVGGLTTIGVTAVGSAISAVLLTRVAEPRRQARQRVRLSDEVRLGLRTVQKDRVLSGLLGFSALSNLFGQWVLLMFLIDAVRRLGLQPGHVGLVLATGAVGTVLGAALSPRVSRRFGSLPTILITSAVDPLALLALPGVRTEWSPDTATVALCCALAVNGFAVGLDTVVVTTVRQRLAPEHLRGRVNAAYRLVSHGAIALGAVVGGAVGGHLGARASLVVGCLGAFTATVWVIAWAAILARHDEAGLLPTPSTDAHE